MKNIKNELKSWQGEKILMAIFPHPDDETMATGGLLLAANKLGWNTIVVTLTKGEAGQNHLKAGELESIRVEELNKATKVLKVDKLVIGNYPDGKLRQTESAWSKWLNVQMFKYNPAWIVTYDPSGLTGHPDHITLSKDLIKHHKSKLWFTTMPKTLKYYNPKIIDYLTDPTHKLDLELDWIGKSQAAYAHKSQHLGKSLPIPLWMALAYLGREWYHEYNPKIKYKSKFVDFKI